MAKLKATGLVVQVERKALLDALEPAAGAAERRATVPILSCVRVRAEAGHLVLTGTDMDLQVRAECSAMVEAEGPACCDAALLLHAVKAAGPEVRLELDGEQLRVVGADSRSGLAVLPDDEFPGFVEPEGRPGVAVWPGDLLQRLLGRCRAAISTEETRYYLNGVHLRLGRDGVAMAEATDGHRLVRVRAAPVHEGGELAGILPTRAVEAARKLPESVTVTMWRNQALLAAGPISLTTRLIDGSFPDLDRVVPPAIGRHRARAGRAVLRDAVQRVAWAAGAEKTHVVAVEIDQVVRLRAQDGAGVAWAETEIRAEIEGGPVRVGFNAKYLIEALGSAVAEDVILSGESAAAPWRIDPDQDDGDRIVVMPMRV